MWSAIQIRLSTPVQRQYILWTFTKYVLNIKHIFFSQNIAYVLDRRRNVREKCVSTYIWVRVLPGQARDVAGMSMSKMMPNKTK